MQQEVAHLSTHSYPQPQRQDLVQAHLPLPVHQARVSLLGQRSIMATTEVVILGRTHIVQVQAQARAQAPAQVGQAASINLRFPLEAIPTKPEWLSSPTEFVPL